MGLFRRKKKQDTQTRRMPSGQPRHMSTTMYYSARKASDSEEKKSASDAQRIRQKRSLRALMPSLPSAQASSVISFVILLGIVGMLLYSMTLSASPVIRLAEQQGGFSYRPAEDYASKATALLGENPLQRTKPFFRSASFEDAMKREFPEISQVNALIPFGGRDLTVQVIVSEPFIAAKSGSIDAIVDSDGVLVTTEAASTSNLLPVRFATTQASFNSGDQLFTTQEIELLTLLQRELVTMSIDGNQMVVSDILFDVANGRLEVRLQDIAFYIKLSSYSDPAEQVGGLVASLRQLESNGGLPVEYIDVRVPGRVFVK